MNVKELRMHVAGQPLDGLSGEVRKQVEADPRLKAELEAQARVAGLLSLKSYERPEEAMYGRVRERVRLRLLNEASRRPAPVLEGLPAWARMLAVVVVMLALSVLTHREMLRSPGGTGTGVAAEALPRGDTTPFLHQDPFSSYVLAHPGDSVFGEAPVVRMNPALEADFESLGLPQTNAFEELSLLPVVLPAER